MFKRSDKTKEPTDLYLLTTYDSKAKVYERPVYVNEKEVFMRDVINLMNDPKNQMAPKVLNAHDYAVYAVGTWSPLTGETSLHPPIHVANFHELRAMSNWQEPKYELPTQPVDNVRALSPT